ncbi:hypothetical protein BDZ85DRAFT_318675 [Elsinoe ampelina]|uniref:Uncharacterized protein n=1 Tax=Elsinoe ampelina TaxID=302913 RepID=A0A6A6GCM5_9PEZI|nr:hypothetical protein BDZ85DRAFT_318675 [Elsinoe ampelina]
MQHTPSGSTSENATDTPARLQQQATNLGGADTSATSSTPASTHVSPAIAAVTGAPAPAISDYSTSSEPQLSPTSTRTAITVGETRQVIDGPEEVLRLPSFDTLLSSTQAHRPPPLTLQRQPTLDQRDIPLAREDFNAIAESSEDGGNIDERESRTMNATGHTTSTTQNAARPMQDLSPHQATVSQHTALDVQSGDVPHSTPADTSHISDDNVQDTSASLQVTASSYPSSEPASPVIQQQPGIPPVQVFIELAATIPRSLVTQPLPPSHGPSVTGTQGSISHDDGLELLRTYREMELQHSLATSTIRESPGRSSEGLDSPSGIAVDTAQPSNASDETEVPSNVEVELSTSTTPEASTKGDEDHVATADLEDQTHTDSSTFANIGSGSAQQDQPSAFANDGEAEGQATEPITAVQSMQDIDDADLSSYRFAAEQQALRAARQPSEDTIPARSFGSTQDEEEEQEPARKKRRVE